MRKKEILFVYPYMMTGGSTTSLLSVLGSIDYNCYNVDILFYQKKGELSGYLPKEVNILPYACKYENDHKLHIRKLFSPISCMNAIRGRILSIKQNNHWLSDQFGSKDNVRYCYNQEKVYDAAFSYLEFWPMYYLAEKVKARTKAGWIHTDCEKLGLIPELEDRIFEKIDNIVLVSAECKRMFQNCFSKWDYKAIVIENFLSISLVKKRAEEEADFYVERSKINLITVCRIDFTSKGLDRAVSVVEKLVNAGYERKFHWYVVGEGKDYEVLKCLITERKLGNSITLLGAKNNPFPYEKKCDVFFLPSYYEGKPVSVTEAQILGLVPIVTRYSSAEEQISNNIDGLIVDNNEEAILLGLRSLLESPQKLENLRNGVLNKSLEFVGEKQFQKLLYSYCQIEE